MAEVLNINKDMLKCYDYKDPMDIVYFLLWIEEVSPYYVLNKKV